MTTRGTLLLVLVLTGLAGYLWLVEAQPRRTPAPPPTPLLGVPVDAVARVELAEPPRPLVAQRAPDGTWTDAGGRRWPDDAVSELVRTLARLAPVMTVDPDPREPADYGLGAGAPRLSLQAADGRPLLALDLGERNPASTGLYVRRAGEPTVLLVGAVLEWELEKVRNAAPPS
jgi:hypothetical protein